jgi:hypothetical protein
MRTVSIALVHHPVLNKNNEIIGSAVTNLDLHDIARAAKTYGVANYYITTPYEDQKNLAKEIIGHWQTGHGATYNPARKEALATIRLAGSVEEVVSELKQQNEELLVVATSARTYKTTVSYSDLRNRIENGTSVLLLFGTAHGLAQQVMDMADVVMEPLKGAADYNHLSVRSAASIIFDRLLG